MRGGGEDAHERSRDDAAEGEGDQGVGEELAGVALGCGGVGLDVGDEVGPGADLGSDVEELGDDGEAQLGVAADDLQEVALRGGFGAGVEQGALGGGEGGAAEQEGEREQDEAEADVGGDDADESRSGDRRRRCRRPSWRRPRRGIFRCRRRSSRCR